MEIQRSKWWKYYFYLLVAITALGSIEFLINEASGIAEAIYVPLSIIGLIGLYGYVFSRKILHRTF
jgi:Ca2+/Na+ antiporter